MAFFGDGAVANGAFHEGINLATNWQLPVLFVCENNLYATEVAFVDTTRNPQVANRAAAYGLPGIAVDGNDVAEVYAVAGEAITRARQGGGPTLIECKTYRTRPHAEGMRDGGYRSTEEIDEWKKRDPIPTFCPPAARGRPRPPRRTRRDHSRHHRADRRGPAICPRQPVARPGYGGRPRL